MPATAVAFDQLGSDSTTRRRSRRARTKARRGCDAFGDSDMSSFAPARTRSRSAESHASFAEDRDSRGAKDSVKQYLDEIGKYPRLSETEERLLGERAKAGDEDAIEWLIKCNLRLVVRICKDFTRNTFQLLDLVSAGNEGLIVACRKFDPEMGVPLGNYSSIWIKQRVMKYVAERGLPIKVPSYRAAIVNQVVREKGRLQGQMGRAATALEIAEELRKRNPEAADKAPTAVEVEEILCLIQPALELDAPVADESGSTTLGAFFGDTLDEAEANLDGQLDRIDMARFVEDALSLLTEREANVIRWAFGLETGRPMDLEQIGNRLGVTRERVRQIKNAAVKKLSGEASLLQYVG